jgi:hypothetical protein
MAVRTGNVHTVVMEYEFTNVRRTEAGTERLKNLSFLIPYNL